MIGTSLLGQRCSKKFCICVSSAPINSLLLVDENVLATGDDTGGIRLWDQRKEGPLMDMRQHEEYIADMALDPAKKLLLTARYSLEAASPPFPVLNVSLGGYLQPSLLLCSLYSGDGCLGVFNIRRRRFELLSEPQSGDLTSVTLMKVQLGGAGWGCAIGTWCDVAPQTWFALFPCSVGRRWPVAPVKVPSTSSTGMALGPQVTALPCELSPLTAWFQSLRVCCVPAPLMESSGERSRMALQS